MSASLTERWVGEILVHSQEESHNSKENSTWKPLIKPYTIYWNKTIINKKIYNYGNIKIYTSYSSRENICYYRSYDFYARGIRVSCFWDSKSCFQYISIGNDIIIILKKEHYFHRLFFRYLNIRYSPILVPHNCSDWGVIIF